jgi:uncharacterized damage-inducible protein DinB
MKSKTMRMMCMAVALVAGGMLAHPSAVAQAADAPSQVYGHLYKLLGGEVIDAAEAMPADKYDFVPANGKFDGARSFGSQVEHLTEANYAFFKGFGIPGAPDDAKLKSLKTKPELVQALKDSFAYAEKNVDAITAQNAFVPVGTGERKLTRAGAATFCLAHNMDHYGQMVEYLRMNGIVPPASVKK